MTTTREYDQAGTGGAIAARLTSEQVWRALTRASFAVVSYVTPTGEPRSSGVVYATDGAVSFGRRLRQLEGQAYRGQRAGGGDRTGPAGRPAVAASPHPARHR